MPQKNRLAICELALPSDADALYPLIKQLNPKLTRRQFNLMLKDMLPRGYRCVGAYEGGRLVGVCGFWIEYRFWCLKSVDLDNVVVDKACRSAGIGRQLVAWVEKEAKKLNCTMAVLDSYTTSYAAHRFYFREGYSILGYHFVKTL